MSHPSDSNRLAIPLFASVAVLVSCRALACNGGGDLDVGDLFFLFCIPLGYVSGLVTVVLFAAFFAVPTRAKAIALVVFALGSLGLSGISLATDEMFRSCRGDPNSGNCAFGWITVTQGLIGFVALLLAMHHRADPSSASPVRRSAGVPHRSVPSRA